MDLLGQEDKGCKCGRDNVSVEPGVGDGGE